MVEYECPYCHKILSLSMLDITGQDLNEGYYAYTICCSYCHKSFHQCYNLVWAENIPLEDNHD